MSQKYLYGVQPILEALRGGGQNIGHIYLARGAGGKTQRITSEAKRAKIPVSELPREELDKRSGNASHQGVLARLNASEVPESSLEEMLLRAEEAQEEPLILLLDGIQDPGNLGAILRSAHALGAHGVVIPKNRSAPVNAGAVRASAGAALHIPVAKVANLKHVLPILKQAGVWVAAACMGGSEAASAPLTGPLALVIGAEDKGVRPSLAKQCDYQVSIPLSRGFDSLNAATAGAILLYEVRRQRLEKSRAE